jgi:uncharacterized protein (TIRG00374 family)
MKKQTIAIFIAVIVTIVLIALLLSQIDIRDVIDTLADIEPLYLVIGFGLYVLSYFFRALRFYILLKREAEIKDLFKIVCVHNMINNILPFRTGELSYIYLLKKLHNKKVGEGIATLIVARIFDFIIIALLFFTAVLISFQGLPSIVNKILWIITIFLISIVALLIILVYFGKKFIVKIKNIFIRFGVINSSILVYLLRKGDETIESFGTIKSKSTFIICAMTSIGVWLSVYLMTQVLLNAMNVQMDIKYVIIASTIPIFSVLLPIQGIAGFGTLESAWTISLMSFGVSKEMSILAGFSLHIISIVYFTVLGGVYYLKLKI